MSPVAIRRLLAIHRWCGIVVSLNLFFLAATGAILVFHDEIDEALGVVPNVAAAGPISIAKTLAVARAENPGGRVVYLAQQPDEHPGIVFVGITTGASELADAKNVVVDADRYAVMDHVDVDGSFTGIVLKLHAELFAGAIGRILVGLVGAAFLVSLVTGVLVYGPMMKRFVFGTIRREHHLRTLLADVHKLVGVATFGWTLVVAVTGLMLSLGSVLLQIYAMTELSAFAATYAKEPPVTDFATADDALANVERASGRTWSFVAFPGAELASPRHYTVLLRGGEGLDAKVVKVGFVDATAPEKLEVRELPFYLKALLLSEPLHFGDYAGLPLKVVWAVFSVVTMGLTASGLWVTIASWRQRRAAVASSKNLAEVAP